MPPPLPNLGQLADTHGVGAGADNADCAIFESFLIHAVVWNLAQNENHYECAQINVFCVRAGMCARYMLGAHSAWGCAVHTD